MSSNISVINEAMVRIGVPPLASLDDLSAQALSATNIFNAVQESCLSEHPWSFALREVKLPKVALPEDVKPNFLQYSNIYQLPSDCVCVLGFWSRARFMVAGAQLFTDESDSELLYTRKVGPPLWNPLFRRWVVLSLAAAFAVSLTDDYKRAEVFYAEAREARRTAKAIDSQQTPSYVFDMLREYASAGNYLGAS